MSSSVTTIDVLTTDGEHPDRLSHATQEVRDNAADTAKRVERLLASFGHRRRITSGYRPADVNKSVGGSPNSWHTHGRAVDLVDHDGELAEYCLCEQTLLEHFGLWLEDPRWTRKNQKPTGEWEQRWVHVQTKPPPSGRRVFRPAGPQPR